MKKVVWFLAFPLILSGCSGPVNQPIEITPNIEKASFISKPIENFESRVTLKPFGIYITPKTSPVQPEKFTGYHTGADAEILLDEQSKDIPVYSIADGNVLLARFATGYGGVMAIKYEIKGSSYVAIYGHLRVSSFTVSVGDKVKAGQQIAVLGKAYSKETDGEREHLHFAIKLGGSADIRGYVSKKSDLSGWVDPVAFLKSM